MIVFYVPCSTSAEAKKIGRKLVEEKLAGCVHVWQNEVSIYPWEGKIHEESEAILLIKTVASRRINIISRIKELHSYSVPCILELGVNSINSDYEKWLDSVTH